MGMQAARAGRWAVARGVLSWAALACAAPGAGAFDQGTLMVTARVLRHTSIRFTPPPSITISAADVARGYLEHPTPVEVAVQSNSPEGYALVFERQGEQVQEAKVDGFHAPLVVGKAGATAARRATGRGLWRDTLQLRFRFELSPDAVPGEHPWPLNISLMTP